MLEGCPNVGVCRLRTLDEALVKICMKIVNMKEGCMLSVDEQLSVIFLVTQ